MKALLIDPYQKKIHQIEITKEVRSWCAMLRCNCFDRVEIHTYRNGTRALDIWVDDEGLLQEPTPPTFEVRGYDYPLAGYGLVLGANLTNGESLDCPASAEQVAKNIRFEPWEKRLDVKDYFEQLTRVPTWETV